MVLPFSYLQSATAQNDGIADFTYIKLLFSDKVIPNLNNFAPSYLDFLYTYKT